MTRSCPAFVTHIRGKVSVLAVYVPLSFLSIRKGLCLSSNLLHSTLTALSSSRDVNLHLQLYDLRVSRELLSLPTPKAINTHSFYAKQFNYLTINMTQTVDGPSILCAGFAAQYLPGSGPDPSSLYSNGTDIASPSSNSTSTISSQTNGMEVDDGSYQIPQSDDGSAQV